MPLLAPLPTPKPPPPDEFAGLERLDRPELDEAEPDTKPDPRPLPALEWDEADGESGVKRRGPPAA